MINKTHTSIIIILVLVVAGFAGGAFTYARMSDTETAEVSITAGTWDPTPNETADSNTTKGISFVAFCVVDGSSGSVTITGQMEKTGGDSIGITYEHTFGNNLVAVVNKADSALYEDDSPDGTVVSGEVELVGRTGKNKSGRRPNESCGDSAVAIKFEYDEASGEFVRESGDRSSSVTSRAFEAASIETSSGETDNTNDSNATQTATPAETTVETQTPTETVIATPEIGTQTPMSTPPQTLLSTITETTTETTAEVNHPLQNLSDGNETSASKTDE